MKAVSPKANPNGFSTFFTNLVCSFSSAKGTLAMLKGSVAILAAVLVANSQFAIPLLEKNMAIDKEVSVLEVLSKKKLKDINCEEFVSDPSKQVHCLSTKQNKIKVDALQEAFNWFVATGILYFYVFISIAAWGFLLRMGGIEEKLACRKLDLGLSQATPE